MGCPWDRFLSATLDTCEPDVCGWVVHPAETATAFVYFLVAVVLRLGSRDTDQDRITRYLPALIAIVGTGALFFHVSMAAIFQTLDLVAIYPLTAVLVGATLAYRYPRVKRSFPLVIVTMAVSGSALPFLGIWVGFTGLAFAAAIVATIGLRISAGPATDLRRAFFLLLPGVILLVLDHGQLGCVSGTLEHVIQPHAWWHALSAASFIYLYRYVAGLARTGAGANPLVA